MARSLPRPFGKYTLLGSLGRGGMGEVFAASLNGGVAAREMLCVVKTLHAVNAEDREYVARFLDEARLTVRLNHRNVCQVFEYGVVDGQHYLAMEFVRGRDLRTVWHTAAERGYRIERGVALHIVAEALGGLDYAHQLTDGHGHPLAVVHRDVSPQNVMVGFDGAVKVIDFGLAASTMKLERTEANVVLGRVPYMPPEQVRGEPLDARADVFAAAVVLYEFITGRRFYDGVDPYNLPAVVASGAYLPAGFQQLDPDLRTLLWRALAGDRNRRTRSAGLFAEELRIYATSSGALADAATLRAFLRDLFGDARAPWDRDAIDPTMAAGGPTPAATDAGAVPSLGDGHDAFTRTETDVRPAVPAPAPAAVPFASDATAAGAATPAVAGPPATQPGPFEPPAPTGPYATPEELAGFERFERTERVERFRPLPDAVPASSSPRTKLVAAAASVAFLAGFLTFAHTTLRGLPSAGATAAAGFGAGAVAAVGDAVVDAGTAAVGGAVVDAGTAAVGDAVFDAGAAAVVGDAVVDAGAAAVVGDAVVDAGAAAAVGDAVVDAGVAAAVDAGVDAGVDPPRRRPAPGSRIDVALKRVERAAGGTPSSLFSTLRNVCGPSLCGEIPRDDAFAVRVEACRRRCVDWLLSR